MQAASDYTSDEEDDFHDCATGNEDAYHLVESERLIKYQTIFAAFQDQNMEGKIKGHFDKNTGSLRFDNDAHNTTANSFFDSQKNIGVPFLFRKGIEDHYAFSDGEGQYLMGSRSKIVEYCQINQLTEPKFAGSIDNAEAEANSRPGL